MKKIITTMLLFVSCHAFADEWHTQDTILEATYLALHITDWAQTRYASRQTYQNGNPHYDEANPIIGTHPSYGKINAYFIVTGIGHVWLSSIMPERARSMFQYVTIGVELDSTIHNVQIGIHAKF